MQHIYLNRMKVEASLHNLDIANFHLLAVLSYEFLMRSRERLRVRKSFPGKGEEHKKRIAPVVAFVRVGPGRTLKYQSASAHHLSAILILFLRFFVVLLVPRPFPGPVVRCSYLSRAIHIVSVSGGVPLNQILFFILFGACFLLLFWFSL